MYSFCFFWALVLTLVTLVVLYRFAIDYEIVIPDDRMDGKVVLITGGTSGIGLESAKIFVELGADVIITSSGRIEGAGEAIATEINDKAGSEKCVHFTVDQNALANMNSFCDLFLEKYSRLDVLVCNAGYGAYRNNESSADGYEKGFAVMHLAHFLLLKRVLPLLRKSKGKVVSVSSQAHAIGKDYEKLFDNISPENPNLPKGIQGSYCRAKFSNILMSFYLSKTESEITAYSLHPGAVYTPIWGNDGVKNLIYSQFFKPAKKGAADIILASTSSNVTNGCYITFLKEIPVSLSWTRLRHQQTENFELAKKLWEISEKVVFEHFGDIDSSN